jgi:hypothetical protein
MADAPAPSAAPTTWEIDVPLLSNGPIVGGLIRVFVIAVVIVGGLLTLLLATQGEWDAVGPVLLGCAILGGALCLIGLAAMAVLFGGRMRFRFTVDDERVRCNLIDRRARAVNRLAAVAGVAAGRPGATGAGLMAMSRETTEVTFSGSFRAIHDPRRRTITFRNGWRDLLVVYAGTDYEAVARRIETAMDVHGTARRVPTVGRSPLPGTLARTAVAVVASAALFPLVDAFNTDLFVLTLVLCFAVATVWLIRLFGYVVLACLVLVAVGVGVSAVEVRESFLAPGTTYRHLEVFDEETWLTLAVGTAGAAVLATMSIRAVTGRMPSMLERDAETAGEA